MTYKRWVAQQTRAPRFNVLVIECERCGRLDAVGVLLRGQFIELSALDSASRSIVKEALEDRLPKWPDVRVEITKVVAQCGKCADETEL